MGPQVYLNAKPQNWVEVNTLQSSISAIKSKFSSGKEEKYSKLVDAILESFINLKTDLEKTGENKDIKDINLIRLHIESTLKNHLKGVSGEELEEIKNKLDEVSKESKDENTKSLISEIKELIDKNSSEAPLKDIKKKLDDVFSILGEKTDEEKENEENVEEGTEDSEKPKEESKEELKEEDKLVPTKESFGKNNLQEVGKFQDTTKEIGSVAVLNQELTDISEDISEVKTFKSLFSFGGSKDKFTWKGLKDFLENDIFSFKNVFVWLKKNLKRLYKVIWDNLLKPLIFNIGKTVLGIISSAIKLILNGAKEIINFLYKKIVLLFGPTLLAINLVVTAIMAILVGVGYLLYKAYNWFKENIMPHLEPLFKMFGEIWDKAKQILGDIIDGVVTVITDIWDALKKIIDPLWELVKTVLKWVWEVLKTTINWIADGIAWVLEKITSIINWIGNFFKDLWNGLVEWWNKLPITEWLNSIKEWWNKNGGFTGLLSKFGGIVWEKIKGLFSAIGNVASKVVSGVKKLWNSNKSEEELSKDLNKNQEKLKELQKRYESGDYGRTWYGAKKTKEDIQKEIREMNAKIAEDRQALAEKQVSNSNFVENELNKEMKSVDEIKEDLAKKQKIEEDMAKSGVTQEASGIIADIQRICQDILTNLNKFIDESNVQPDSKAIENIADNISKNENAIKEIKEVEKQSEKETKSIFESTVQKENGEWYNKTKLVILEATNDIKGELKKVRTDISNIKTTENTTNNNTVVSVGMVGTVGGNQMGNPALNEV